MIDRKSKINLIKIDANENQFEHSDNQLNDMDEQVRGFCQNLLSNAQDFSEELACDDLVEYIGTYHRILYSTISNTIYTYYQEQESKEADNRVGSMLSNAESIIAYTKTKEFAEKKTMSEHPEYYDDASKAILKIWDHISLAQQQYGMLKKSDEQYKKQIDEKLVPFKDDLKKDLDDQKKEMTTQLITMVGIFTALAFLIFGSTSALDNVFTNIKFPVFKLMSIGSVWGLCVLNLVFVFLFCVGKMTKMNFASTTDSKATIFRKYPVVWWSNWTILGILMLSLLGYYFSTDGNHDWFDDICLSNPTVFFILGLVGIIGLMACLAWRLLKETRFEKVDSDSEKQKSKNNWKYILPMVVLFIGEFILIKNDVLNILGNFSKVTISLGSALKVIIPIAIIIIGFVWWKKNQKDASGNEETKEES